MAIVANTVALGKLIDRGGEIVAVHFEERYPEIYVRVNSVDTSLYVCRVNDVDAFKSFFTYEDLTPPSSISTVCSELS